MEAIIYVIIFVTFLCLVFYVLRATRLEEAFKQGHIFEIRAAYLILSIALAYLLTEFVYRLLSLSGVSL